MLGDALFREKEYRRAIVSKDFFLKKLMWFGITLSFSGDSLVFLFKLVSWNYSTHISKLYSTTNYVLSKTQYQPGVPCLHLPDPLLQVLSISRPLMKMRYLGKEILCIFIGRKYNFICYD